MSKHPPKIRISYDGIIQNREDFKIFCEETLQRLRKLVIEYEKLIEELKCTTVE